MLTFSQLTGRMTLIFVILSQGLFHHENEIGPIRLLEREGGQVEEEISNK